MWVKRLHTSLNHRLSTYMDDDEFIDSEKWFHEPIVSKLFIPENRQNINIRYYSIISSISIFFETRAIWTNLIQIPEPIKVFSITGHEKDVQKTLNFLQYIIDHYNALEVFITQQSRNNKKRARNKNIKNTRNMDARTLANLYVTKKLIETEDILLELLKQREYSVLHDVKLSYIDKRIMLLKKLNYKKHSDKRPTTIFDAQCNKSELILNRLIHE